MVRISLWEKHATKAGLSQSMLGQRVVCLAAMRMGYRHVHLRVRLPACLLAFLSACVSERVSGRKGEARRFLCNARAFFLYSCVCVCVYVCVYVCCCEQVSQFNGFGAGIAFMSCLISRARLTLSCIQTAEDYPIPGLSLFIHSELSAFDQILYVLPCILLFFSCPLV
jgi:hypothetical protein